MKALLKDPLLHCVVLGAILFSASGWLGHGTSSDRVSRDVRISDGDVQWLHETWARQWQREPTRNELHGLVTEYLKEELLAREAQEMGLDRDDPYVRRRLAQKVEFLVQDTSRLPEPANGELRAFYDAHSNWFSDDATVSFTQIYFTTEHRAELTAAFTRLEPNGNPEPGDRLSIEVELHDATEQAVAAQFGAGFARAVFALEPGAWHGPIESGFGLHLVRVSAKTPARPRAFADVRAQVLERWREQRQRDESNKHFAALRAKYNVVTDDGVRALLETEAPNEVVQ